MSPFDVQPPAWLERVAKPVDGTEMGRALGMSLMQLSNTFQRDPDAPASASWLDSRKGFEKGFAEVSNDQIDPQWRVKGQLMANKLLEEKANLAATAAIAEERRKEASAWTADAPVLAPWITATPEQRKTMAAPTAQSRLGMQTLQKQSLADQQYYTKQDQMDNRLEQERLKADHSAGITARVGDWNDAYAAADALTQSDISAMKNNGRLPSGMPTPEAITRLNVYRRQSGMTDFGTKATEYLQRPGRFDAETVDRLKELDADERDLRKQIATANAAGEADKVTGLTAQLDEVRRMRAEARGDKPVSGATAPSDPFAKQRESLQDKIIDAQARGLKKEQTAAENDLAILNRKQALKQGNPIIYKTTRSADAVRQIQSIPLGGSIYIDHLGKWKKIATEDDRQNILDQFGGHSTKTSTAATVNEMPPSRNVVMSATAPAKGARQRRIADLQQRANTLGRNLNQKNVSQYLELKDELDRLEKTQ